jgi:prepilin-type N-terminal cleavage/methylation domain-containing protein
MNQRGASLVEMVITSAILALLAAIGFPYLKAYSNEAHILGAARIFQGEFRKARSMAVRRGVYTAIRFERHTDDEGADFSVYMDGNGNGVRTVDIESGKDVRVAGPFPLDGKAPGVRVGILEGTPTPPPDHGTLDPSDPILFGRGDILSFSPLGTATPGTFYLAGEGLQAAVRVTNASRVRLLFCRGGYWRER